MLVGGAVKVRMGGLLVGDVGCRFMMVDCQMMDGREGAASRMQEGIGTSIIEHVSCGGTCGCDNSFIYEFDTSTRNRLRKSRKDDER